MNQLNAFTLRRATNECFLQNEFKITFIYALLKLVGFLGFFLLLLMVVLWLPFFLLSMNDVSRRGMVLFQDGIIIEIKEESEPVMLLPNKVCFISKLAFGVSFTVFRMPLAG